MAPKARIPKRFHLNGHNIGFHPQTQELEPNFISILLTLEAKGLIKNFKVKLTKLRF